MTNTNSVKRQPWAALVKREEHSNVYRLSAAASNHLQQKLNMKRTEKTKQAVVDNVAGHLMPDPGLNIWATAKQSTKSGLWYIKVEIVE